MDTFMVLNRAIEPLVDEKSFIRPISHLYRFILKKDAGREAEGVHNDGYR